MNFLSRVSVVAVLAGATTVAAGSVLAATDKVAVPDKALVRVVGEEQVAGHRTVMVEFDARTSRMLQPDRVGLVRLSVDPQLGKVRQARFWNIDGELIYTVLLGDFRGTGQMAAAYAIELTNHRTSQQTAWRLLGAGWSRWDRLPGRDSVDLTPMLL
jgi:hypothetical protein